MPRLCAPLAAASPAPGRAGPPRARVCLLHPSCSRETPQRVSLPTRTRRFTYPKLGTTRPCGCPAGVDCAGARPTSVGGSPASAWSQTNRRRDHRWWLGGSRRHHRARLHGAGAGGGDGRGHGRRAADGEPRASDPPIVLCLSPASQLPPTCLHPGWSASHPLSTTP